MKTSLSSPRNRNFLYAFTLIELLTVIAIIGILASILIPVVGKVRASARTAKCASHLRSTATAMVSHINEHNGILRTMSSGSGSTGYMWTRVLRQEGYFEGARPGASRAAEEILCPEG